MPTDRDALRQWTEIVSALHLECAPNSNHDSFEMGMIAAIMLGPTHGGMLRQGAGERLRGAGVDAGKLVALARGAIQRARLAPPPSLRLLPKERSHAAWQSAPHPHDCMCEACAAESAERAEALRLADA